MRGFVHQASPLSAHSIESWERAGLGMRQTMSRHVGTRLHLEEEFRLTRKEKHNGHWVADCEPVDLYVTHSEVAVPSRRPSYITRVPDHTVGEGQCRLFCNREENDNDQLPKEKLVLLIAQLNHCSFTPRMCVRMYAWVCVCLYEHQEGIFWERASVRVCEIEGWEGGEREGTSGEGESKKKKGKETETFLFLFELHNRDLTRIDTLVASLKVFFWWFLLTFIGCQFERVLRHTAGIYLKCHYTVFGFCLPEGEEKREREIFKMQNYKASTVLIHLTIEWYLMIIVRWLLSTALFSWTKPNLNPSSYWSSLVFKFRNTVAAGRLSANLYTAMGAGGWGWSHEQLSLHQ